jgi:hypothetical protein
MEHAEGQYIKFLDDDDRLSRGALTQEVEILRETGAAVSCGNLRIEGERSVQTTRVTDPSPDLASGIFRGKVVTYPHVFLYRRETLADVDWDPVLQYHQDTDFAVQVASKGLPTVSLNRVVGIWNDHEGDRITTRVKQGEDHAEIVRQRVATIEMGVERLRKYGELHDHHRESAARGIWRWAHITSAYDLQCFRECVRAIRRIDPNFKPPRSSAVLSFTDHVVGASTTEKFLFPFRWMKKQLQA